MASSHRQVAVVVVVMHAGMMLLVQRKDRDRPRNYWEFPNGYPRHSEALDDAAVSILLANTNLVAESSRRLGIFDKPKITSDLTIVYGARMNHHAVPSSGSPDIVSVTWAAPSKLPEMAPGHYDMMHIYLNSSYH